jgi:electron transfer flavoprotein alpha subunit
MGTGILVVCEHEGGSFKRSAYELLGKAVQLSSELGGEVTAVVLGEADASTLGGFGAARAYVASGEGVISNNTGPATRAVQAAIVAADPAIVLSPASPQGKDIMPRLSARLNAGLASEITDLNVDGGTIIARRPQFAGKAFSDVRINSALKLYTVRPNSFPFPAAGDGAAEVSELTVELTDHDKSYRMIGQEASTADVADLTEAERIVSGGRSVKSKESFDSLIRPLAASIGATPGASRAAVDAGYASHSEQVGQTGKVVNPSLYIACGISGAIQHLAGMRTSRVIVAINKDKDAPIFKHSTYGIVGDMFDICPALTEGLSGGAPIAVPSPKAAAPQEAAAPKKASKAKAAAPAAAPKAPQKPSKPLAAPKNQRAPEPKAETAVAPANPGAQVSVASAGIDPALIEGLRSEISALSAALGSVKKDLVKTVKEENASLKKELQRVEQNARAFQEGGLRRYEDIDGRVVAEVRKVRETLRKGISNDTDVLRDGLFSLRSMAAAVLVLNLFCLILLIALLVL